MHLVSVLSSHWCLCPFFGVFFGFITTCYNYFSVLFRCSNIAIFYGYFARFKK